MVHGIAQSILGVLEDLGNVSEEVKIMIGEQTEEETLRKWLKLAARSKTLDEFETGMKQ